LPKTKKILAIHFNIWYSLVEYGSIAKAVEIIKEDT